MPRFRSALLCGLAVVCGIVLAAPGTSVATPVIASRTGSNCSACHVNPDGGMLRTKTGETYGINTLPLAGGLGPTLEKGLSLAKDNALLTWGGDFRMLGLTTGQDGKESPNLFPMQGDLYLGSRLSDHVSLLTQFGLERGGNPVFREVFGLVDVLPSDAYLKFGKFLPPYGHRLDDHTAYIRKELFVDQSNPVSYGSGVEIGASPMGLYGRFAYLNEDVTPASSSDSTSNLCSAVLGWQGSWLQLGGSFLRVNDNQNWGDATGLAADSAGDRTAYGGYGSASLWRLTWLFEYDLVKNSIDAGKDFDEFLSFNELDLLVSRGTTIKVRYETLDPNRDIADDEWVRTMAGVEFHPWPFVELDAQYRYNDTPEETYGQVLFLVHLWY